jgi:hypothetical protein
MKHIFLVFISILLILTGCSSDGNSVSRGDTDKKWSKEEYNAFQTFYKEQAKKVQYINVIRTADVTEDSSEFEFEYQLLDANRHPVYTPVEYEYKMIDSTGLVLTSNYSDNGWLTGPMLSKLRSKSNDFNCEMPDSQVKYDTNYCSLETLKRGNLVYSDIIWPTTRKAYSPQGKVYISVKIPGGKKFNTLTYDFNYFLYRTRYTLKKPKLPRAITVNSDGAKVKISDVSYELTQGSDGSVALDVRVKGKKTFEPYGSNYSSPSVVELYVEDEFKKHKVSIDLGNLKEGETFDESNWIYLNQPSSYKIRLLNY